MSHSSGLAEYRAALTTPGARGPVLAALIGRMPIAMVGLSLLLYVQRATGSFATAGLVSAGALIGVAVGSVLQGRIMDRIGPSRPLLVTSAVFAVLVTSGVLAIESRAATPVLIALGVGIGLSEPMTGSASRAMWTRLTPPGPTRDAALAYEAISMEVFFILGPAVSGLLLAAPWAGTGVVVGASCMIFGGVWFALTPTIRRFRPAGDEPRGRGLLGALGSPGMRTLALAAMGFGVTIGFIEVAVPAAANAAGNAPAGGLLLGLWSVSSVIFGVLYGVRPWPRAMRLRLPVLLAGFSLLLALLAIPTSLLGLALALLVAGTLVTPQATTHSAAIELVAPQNTATEAFGWVITSVTLGLAFGQSVSGQLVEHVGVWSSYLAAAAVGLVFAAVVYARRRTVGEPAHPIESRSPALV
ncbi:MFS transporter [Actinokineospora iranica]|uniref:Predicted arabinose efflux permease, MFS family n=1 Tax=Actinokineospora iranica TaxID=1271860 RepID=A0A1G6Y412_9PSEU|nr:MFS transporter [Actinokineospora iranica]SDD85148.1 Predicted arabinose efflux permease, MFS family [Actinokineospora iranica]